MEKEKFLLEALGNRIRDIRINNLLLSQRAMAINCGLITHHLSLIETGKKRINIITLRKIAVVCHMSLSELLDFDLWTPDEMHFPKGERF